MDYKGDKPSTEQLLRKRIQRFYRSYLSNDKVRKVFNGQTILKVESLQDFSLALVIHLESLDYFLKFPELKKLLMQLHRVPCAIENSSDIERIRAEMLPYIIRGVQRGVSIADIEAILSINKMAGYWEPVKALVVQEGKCKLTIISLLS